MDKDDYLLRINDELNQKNKEILKKLVDLKDRIRCKQSPCQD